MTIASDLLAFANLAITCAGCPNTVRIFLIRFRRLGSAAASTFNVVSLLILRRSVPDSISG